MFKSLIIISIFMTNLLFSKIIEIEEIEDILIYSNKESLIVIDVDSSIMELRQDLGSQKWLENEIQKNKKVELNNLFSLWHKILLCSKAKSLEKKTPDIIHQLQKNNIQIIGLSRKNIEIGYQTHKQLKSLDIDFSIKPLFSSDIEIHTKYAAKCLDNIIFCGFKNDEVNTFFSFLDQICYYPKKIVFIGNDDQKLLSMKKRAKKQKIPFIGLAYHKIDEISADFDPEITKEQLKYFGKILPDKEAKKLRKLPLNELTK